MRVSRSYRLSFHDAICVNPAWKTLQNPQLYGEQASILALSSRFFIQYELARSLKRAAGGNQWFAHICNFSSGIHVAPNACFDSKAPLPVVLDV